jgi:HK97 gp10 family phage protein
MSITINLNVEGAEQLKQAMARFDDALKSQVQTKLSSWAQTTKTDAERLVPVKTGFLKSTIYAKAQDWQIQVGAEATYAAAVEFGSHTARAKPYLTPAVQNRLPDLQRVIIEALNMAKTEAKL